MLKPKYMALLLPLLLLLLMPMGVAADGPHPGITEDTTLTADHEGSLFIKAHGVTLDCNGYEVIGPGPEGVGIALEAVTGATIKNCRVRDFLTGLHLSQSSGNTLVGNRSKKNGGEGFVTIETGLGSGSGNTFTQNISQRNGGLGYRDETMRAGTAGTGNTYTSNECHGNSLGGSDPTGLC